MPSLLYCVPTSMFLGWRFEAESAGRFVIYPNLGGCLQESVLKVAEAQSRPGTGMYSDNLDLVSRRENVRVAGSCFYPIITFNFGQ